MSVSQSPTNRKKTNNIFFEVKEIELIETIKFEYEKVMKVVY